MRKYLALLLSVLIVAGIGILFWRHTTTKETVVRSVSQPASPTPTYLVALGDSVAAGDGLPVAGSGSAAMCGQSDEAYPYLVAQAKKLPLKQFACSGASTTEGILKSQVVEGQTLTPQLTAARPYLRASDVLITIGANDVNWDSELYSCVTTNCETTSNLAAFNQNLEQLSANLDTILQTVRTFHPNKVLVNTYYPLLNNTDTCLAGYGITASKIQWVNAREAELNTTITGAAKEYKDQAVPISFTGHLLCSTEPWIQTLNGLAPLHPTAAGQASIAQQDMQAL